MAARLDPATQDLASWRELEPGLRLSLSWLKAKPANQPAVAGPPPVTWGRLAATAQRLLELLPRLDADPGLLAREFAWAELAPRPLLTGYYAPILDASPVATPEFPYPLYALPPDVQSVDLGRFHPRWAGQTLTYRVHDGRIEPYFDREQIDRGGALAGRGLELAFLRDRYDAYVLQVQGSGELRFPDGSLHHVLYAGKNGREYVSLGKVMAQDGLIPLEQVSMSSIRAWLDAHPDQEEGLLLRNPSYVFFRLGNAGPLGAMGRLLTPRVSVATDPGVLPLGSVLALAADLPPAGPAAGRALAGLALAQDTGGAIKQAHLDYFCGSGATAGALAGELKATARVWLLLVREEP